MREHIEAGQRELVSLREQVARLTRAVDTDYEQLYREEAVKVAALTKERNELKEMYKLLDKGNREVVIQLAAAQAREAKLREALELWKRARDNAEESELDEYACYCIPMPLFCDAEEAMDEALALPTDDSALQERLKQERERAVREYIVEVTGAEPALSAERPR